MIKNLKHTIKKKLKERNKLKKQKGWVIDVREDGNLWYYDPKYDFYPGLVSEFRKE